MFFVDSPLTPWPFTVMWLSSAALSKLSEGADGTIGLGAGMGAFSLTFFLGCPMVEK